MHIQKDVCIKLPLRRVSLSVLSISTLVAICLSHAQVSTKISSVVPSEAVPDAPCIVRTELLQGETIETVYFLYRPFGASDWTKLEMNLVGNSASITIPERDVLQPFIEYYFVLVNRTGALETYPLSEGPDPLSTPPSKTLQITVAAQEERNQQVAFLSPEPLTALPSDDVLISVSLLRADSLVVRRATQLLLDGVDITAYAVFSDDIIVYAPENMSIRLSPGTHKVTVRLFNRYGSLYQTASLIFTVTGQGKYVERSSADQFTYGVSLQLESRHEQISKFGTWYNRGNIDFNGRADEWRFASNVFVTSDEKTFRQPQDRYFISAETNWMRIGFGDSYPSFPNLVLNGKRVRGLTFSLKFGFFNVDLALGKTSRAIEGSLLKSFPADSLFVEQQRDITAPYAQLDSQTWGKFNYGVYERELFAIRPSFGSGKTWQWGFTYLKSKDDIHSIRFGVRPQENLVVGTDFLTNLDDGRVRFEGQGAFSAFNSDISSGTYSDADIDSLYRDKDKADEVRKVRDVLSNFITVNENLTPLSFKQLATIAYDASLGLNYLGNAFKFTYLYRGNNYNSFGQTFLRKDIRGFNIIDRIIVVRNQLFATVGYDLLHDNIGDTKAATTRFSTLNVALSYYSRPNLPYVTVGFSRFVNNNKLSLNSVDAIDDATNRFFVQSSYELEAGAKHSLSLNVSTSSRYDRSQHHLDIRNTTLSAGITTRYSFPLQTGLDITTNFNRLPTIVPGAVSQDLNYATLSLTGKYSIQHEAVIFTAGFSPTLGDFTRTTIDLGTQWYVLPALSFLTQFSYYNKPGGPDDNIWSLQSRYDF